MGQAEIEQTCRRLCIHLCSERAYLQLVMVKEFPLQISGECQICREGGDIAGGGCEGGPPTHLHRVHRDQRYEERNV